MYLVTEKCEPVGRRFYGEWDGKRVAIFHAAGCWVKSLSNCQMVLFFPSDLELVGVLT